MSYNSTPTAARLRLAPFGYGPAARPVAYETLAECAGIDFNSSPAASHLRGLLAMEEAGDRKIGGVSGGAAAGVQPRYSRGRTWSRSWHGGPRDRAHG